MAAEHVSASTIIINSVVQLVNLAIFFGLFYYFLAGPIIEAAERRKKMLEQLKNADEILKKKMEEAEKQKLKLIQEGMDHKNKLIQQAKKEAEQIKDAMIKQAEREKQAMLEKAKIQIQTEKEELEKAWEQSVKKAVLLVYNKLIGNEDEVVKKYLENIKNYKQ